ncbi:MAG: type II secretion system major pseudopilin GspG [Deltaproteobacteria bacterium]|nr:type II secretion system major pseudopilin GspG [Deltaproteobacteria bacterium]
MNVLRQCHLQLKAFIQKPFKGDSNKGMTLMEIIIVIALLATLTTILVSNLVSTSEEAKKDQAKISMGTIAQSLQLYRIHNNRFPNTEEGLDALVQNPRDLKSWRGPYIESNKLIDPWSNPYDYVSDGRKYEIISAGPDGQMGTEADIHYPAREVGESQ